MRDAFQNTDLILRHQGLPALFVEVYRAGGEQVMDVAEAVHEHTANVIVPFLPDGVGITIWNDDSQTYFERVDILVRNGLMGLILVFIALALFLEIRLALWVVVGLITSGIGALAVMLLLDLAINTISLFAFVLAIGIIGMLLISLTESLLILPNHLSHLHGPEWAPANMADRFFSSIRDSVDRGLNRFLAGPMDRALRFATNHPAVVLAGSGAPGSG